MQEQYKNLQCKGNANSYDAKILQKIYMQKLHEKSLY